MSPKADSVLNSDDPSSYQGKSRLSQAQGVCRPPLLKDPTTLSRLVRGPLSGEPDSS
jgi:hypothetical protein